MLASCCSFVLDVVHYAFELTNNHLLNNRMKSVQDLMNDFGFLTEEVVVIMLIELIVLFVLFLFAETDD